MDINKNYSGYTGQSEHGTMGIRKGPWTTEEDLKLVNWIAIHGSGNWSYLARFAGLKRTGKSCRLRWLNYLHPDVKRGNLTLQEQLLILQLHSRLGNRWSRIAQHLPGRTDNEIKNYWRTRVKKLAKQLKCDVNSMQFRDTMLHFLLPELMERIQAASPETSLTSHHPTCPSNTAPAHDTANCDHTTAYMPVVTAPGYVLESGIVLAQHSNYQSLLISTASVESPETQVSPVTELSYPEDVLAGDHWFETTAFLDDLCVGYLEQECLHSDMDSHQNDIIGESGGCLGRGESSHFVLTTDNISSPCMID
ncbi:hypothetical protein NMG60_11035152 [Bertholletia excelsa]